MKVKIVKEFTSKRIFGELEYFPYQIAFGISIKYLECEGMGWMLRFYFGPFKLWFNLREKKVKKIKENKMKDVRIKEGGRSKGGLNEMPTTSRPNPPKPMSHKERTNGKKRRK